VVGDGRPGPLTRHFYETLTGIQCGRLKDPHGWVKTID
jgi:branched-chain amino acid aminotransferase